MESRTVRLSALSLSNDTMEGKLVANTFTRFAEKDGLNLAAIKRLQEVLGFFEKFVEGLGFCLSKKGDLLSQWRGYASDGTGVAIGFSKEYLELLAKNSISDKPGFFIQEVKYELASHEIEIHPTYLEVKKLIDEGVFSFSGFRSLLDSRTDEEFQLEKEGKEKLQSALFVKLLDLFPKLFLLKSPAFSEEQEWRLISYFLLNSQEPCSYRTLPDRLIPCRDFLLQELARAPIVEIILGPKHLTPVNVVQGFLKHCGFGEVKVRRSEASYR